MSNYKISRQSTASSQSTNLVGLAGTTAKSESESMSAKMDLIPDRNFVSYIKCNDYKEKNSAHLTTAERCTSTN